MKLKSLESVFNNDDDRRTARILFRIIAALLLAYLVVIATAVYWSDWNLIAITILGCLSFSVPLALLVRGQVRAGGTIVIVNVLITTTIMAMIGQGTRDIALIAYPVIVVIASLIMPRRDFFCAAGLTLIAIGGIVSGEIFGWYAPLPVASAGWGDLLLIVMILVIAIMAVDWLAENMRENLRRAHQEIARREIIEALLLYQSSHDALTGIYNRLFFEEELARFDKGREFPVSIVIADVDDLKIVNDTQGHAVGDELLRRTTTVLTAVFRAGDVLARIGGDEFAVLLPNTPAVTADQMVTRVREKLSEHTAQYPDIPIELSLGAATAETAKLVEAFVVADQRMYTNKANRKSQTHR
jgi:diguanylate cyclase (GGDEF)-like protein